MPRKIDYNKSKFITVQSAPSLMAELLYKFRPYSRKTLAKEDFYDLQRLSGS